MTELERFRLAYRDAPLALGDRWERERADMRYRLEAWMRKTGDDVITAALAIEARERWSFRQRVALAVAVEMLAEAQQ